MLKYFLLWFPMLLLAVINGTARDLGYKRYFGELTAHQISTLTLIILFGIYIGLILKKFPPESALHTWQIGFLWLILTLIFEFGFGIFRGNSMSHLLNEYNLLKGRVWILIPIWITIAPYLFFRFR